jgi:effector-binding domain-containing protein
MNKNLSEIFDVSPLNEKKPKTEVVTTHYNEPNMDEDLTDAYQQSKENLQGIIDSGKDAMEEILQIAKAGQHPRAFEVYGGILKNMVDANKELLAIQKQIRSMDDSKKESKSQTNIDKAIFVGSTTELQKLLKNKE